jgi:hypothetical protein
MNYLEWNNAIINHFFNSENEEKEVLLYFSEDVINEIGEKNFPLPEEGYVDDFFRALRLGISGIQNNNYIQRILDLENRYLDKCHEVDNIPFNYPPYLTYLLAFMLPFTSGGILDGLNSNNFHHYAKEYFEKKKLCGDYDNRIKNKLKLIDYLWNKIIYWLFEDNNFSLGIIETIDNPVSTRKYVSKFEYHIIFRKEQEDKLSIIFDNNNILPNEPLDENNIKQLLLDNAKELRFTNDTVTKIINNEYIGEKLVKRAYTYYKNWDGTNKYDYSKNSSNETKQRAYSRKRIVLCLKFDVLTQIIEAKHFRIYSVDGLPEEFHLIDSTNKEYKGIEQSLQNPLYSNPITDCFQNFNHGIELKDNVNKIKCSWKEKAFYVFKKDSQLNDWVEIPRIEFNIGKTLILATKSFYESNLKTWFESDNIPTNYKKLYNNNSKNNLPDDWLALTVEQITKYQHPNINELRTSSEATPKINFDKEFFLDACIYSDILPNVWIENTEIDNDLIITEYNDGLVLSLKKNEDLNIFHFTEEHLNFKNKCFKIKYRDVEYPRYLKIIDFDKKKTNEEIKQIQPKRNLIGNNIKPYENLTNYFQGIEHCFDNNDTKILKATQRNPVTNECIFISNKDSNSLNHSSTYSKKQIGNILLNYLSAKGKITKPEYDITVIRLLNNSDVSDNLKKLIRHSLYDLQNLGYIDYDAEQGIICINKASLVIKPSEFGTTLLLVGARDNKFVQTLINYARTGSCDIDIHDSPSHLLPQTIFIKFKKCNHTLVKDFAKHFNLHFKGEEQLFTQFALANAHKVSAWENFVNKTEDLNLANDFEGGELFDIETLKFKVKQSDFDKQLCFIRFQNINGYKTIYRLWYNSCAYEIQEGHYGIYLYLYLYKIKNHVQNLLDKKTNIIGYDSSKKYLAVPLNSPLPKYFSIALTLLSGVNPKIQYINSDQLRHKGFYLIYKNIDSLFCKNTLNNLGNQFINPITINIE